MRILKGGRTDAGEAWRGTQSPRDSVAQEPVEPPIAAMNAKARPHPCFGPSVRRVASGSGPVEGVPGGCVADVLRWDRMSSEVSVRELRNHTAEVLRRVEAGERLRVTVDRRPVAELAPLPARDVWVPRERVLSALAQADAALRDDLADALPDTVDDL